MSTTIEAPSADANAEAQAALSAEAARRAAAAAATGMTQAEREAAADFEPAAETPAPKRKRRAPAAQGNLAGGWEELIGGNEPSESKIKIVGGAIQPVNSPDKIRKGARFRVLVDVVSTGYTTKDKLDSATHDVASTTETRELKIVGAQFLDPGDYIATDDGTDVAAEAQADAADHA